MFDAEDNDNICGTIQNVKINEANLRTLKGVLVKN